MADAQRVKVGRDTVSWGPRNYGPDMMVANCPVSDVDDLIKAVRIAADRISMQHVTPDVVVSQHVSTKIERESEDGPGGATNTVTPGLTTDKEWLMADGTREPQGSRG